MDTATILQLVKARLGISSTIRDTYLLTIIDGIIAELEDEKGIHLIHDNPNHLMFIVDYATWRYQSINSIETTSTSRPLSMPRHLQYRLHNLMLHNGGDRDV